MPTTMLARIKMKTIDKYAHTCMCPYVQFGVSLLTRARCRYYGREKVESF